ncbi:DCC1-like thiol-disulfide oxidoreductase family protein [Desertivirga xinjiangensis]|uniref:DCC1-like thiol-disulfide oxidoreductase family protein n=1 Tax=Desertivirga xinjiangensis TaxID=539206 RepID=UPI002108917A|nr:DCC1-like thiol-disulfide oxidoreductase family protein [Pedobacter xinjiangensis]
MTTLKNHLILFDAECPMCRVYTRAFVESGMLDRQGRAAYQEINEQACPVLDRQRAANEIALVNLETGEVTYGVQSLFTVFAAPFPVLKPLFLFLPFVWLMSRLYAFISYNRRVIVPASITSEGDFNIQPSFRLDYRIAYLLVSCLFTAKILSDYSLLLKGLIPAGNPFREYMICGGQLLFQGIIIGVLDRSKRWEYLGNMMTISFAGALLLLPALLLAPWLNLSSAFYGGWFLGVAALMLLEHIRRSKLLQLGYGMSFSWALYRVLVLLFILITT